MNIIALARPVRTRRWAAYLIALLVTLVAVGTNKLFASALDPFPLLMAMMATTVVAFLGGRGPAIVTASLSEIISLYRRLAPFDGSTLMSPAVYIGVLFFVILCAVVILLMHGMFTANEALQASEASLIGLNDDLERRVADRTATLVEAQRALRANNQNLEALVEARVGDLRSANEEIQRFAYIVSHDLRAPLVNVLGFTSELEALRADLAVFLDDVASSAPSLVTADRRTAIEVDLPEALGFIRSSTQKMDRLISAILKLSRDGQRKLTAEPIDVEALVTAQGQSLAQQLAGRDAHLTIEGDLPRIETDRLAAEQIFGNLIENAVKYLSPDRPGRITVRGRPEGAMLRYEIADNGRGIDAKDFGRIFDLFRRSGEQNTPGEGIGLAYVRNLTRRLGGQVTVMSEYGVGSTFTLTLPQTWEP